MENGDKTGIGYIPGWKLFSILDCLKHYFEARKGKHSNHHLVGAGILQVCVASFGIADAGTDVMELITE